MRLTYAIVVAVLALAAPASGAVQNSDAAAGPTVVAAMPPLYKNCTAFNKKYPHGVGKLKARDRTSSGNPVTTFKRSTKIYDLAMSHNKGLDRDKDRLACEKT